MLKIQRYIAVVDFDSKGPQAENYFESPTPTQSRKFTIGLALRCTSNRFWGPPRISRHEASACAENRHYCTRKETDMTHPTKSVLREAFSKFFWELNPAKNEKKMDRK
ncbi:hypothetical protein AVEN_43745-1 [Araneus ventricosus]|uniref:Uncharacterized protein n=1 Tax=Araneus ventricosus TaxID=182803 RepID=A0A4Y2BY90_ARAVE|nr:hypothetical protein AVEN_43745-1 [Araneus ventricosus]